MMSLTLSLLLIAGIVQAGDMPNKMSVPAYATARSVKVCATYPKLGTTCGTGVFIGKGRILTENHIIGKKTQVNVEFDNDGEATITKIVDHADKVMVLRYDDNNFIPAVVISTDVDEDLAVIQIEDTINPVVILADTFHRGQEVWAVGNPFREDFAFIKTKIVAVILYRLSNGKTRDMILIDSKDNQIRPGFSGGGIYNTNGGLLGLIQLCWPDEKVCAAISAKDADKYNKGAK